jgi:hypothetical protein
MKENRYVNTQICAHERYIKRTTGSYSRLLTLTKELREGTQGRKCSSWTLEEEQGLGKAFLL